MILIKTFRLQLSLNIVSENVSNVLNIFVSEMPLFILPMLEDKNFMYDNCILL